MTITLSNLTCEVIIGILPWERTTPQRVILTLEASYRFEDGIYLDYAAIRSKILHLLQTKHYLLLEEALESISGTLMSEYPLIDSLSLQIGKPDIFEDCSVLVSKSYNTAAPL